MTTSFFATRTIARNFASENGGKVKDFGKDAPNGERWAVLADSLEVATTVAPVAQHTESIATPAAALKAVDAVPTKKVDTSKIKFLNPTSNIEQKVIEVAKVAVQEVRKIVSGIIGEQYLMNDKNKRVRVMYRRNMMPVRLAMSIAKSA